MYYRIWTMKKYITQIQGITWVNITDPDEESRDFLKKKFGFHPLDLSDCESNVQIPKVDVYPKYIFFVFHFPVKDKVKGKKILKERELDVFVGPDFIVTVHHGKDTFEDLNARFREVDKILADDPDPIKQTTGYVLYLILKKFYDLSYNVLNEVGEDITTLDREIFEIRSQDVVEELADIRRNVLALQKAIEPQRLLILRIMKIETAYMPRALNIYFDDINDTVVKIWTMIKNYHSLVKGLSETNEALISHKSGRVIRILTMFSVILLPLTLLSGIYGMNIDTLPFRDHPRSFFIIGGMMLFIALVMLIFFKRRKWI